MNDRKGANVSVQKESMCVNAVFAMCRKNERQRWSDVREFLSGTLNEYGAK